MAWRKEDKNDFLGISGKKGENYGNKQQIRIKSNMHSPKEILDVIQEKCHWTQKTKNED